MPKQSRQWEEIHQLILEARSLLSAERGIPEATKVPVAVLTGMLAQFEEFLDHNELELAWDVLAEVAEHSAVPAEGWRKLARAATLMRLPDKERRATLRAQRAQPKVACDQALLTARLDAEKVYKDLSGFRIVVILEADGWHVDYDLKGLGLAGGGPHYVIDASDGRILSKRYEQ
jgi:hypothetical protein